MKTSRKTARPIDVSNKGNINDRAVDSIAPDREPRTRKNRGIEIDKNAPRWYSGKQVGHKI